MLTYVNTPDVYDIDAIAVNTVNLLLLIIF